ncbi:MAG: hypothetical protein DYG94_07100 [Leptolyngbya sp. PLA3]|nr:MAG: hypothetical protein EDM82_06885 [Cyanobacteria bacterium CYA]MCE7968495.1 hypothetical protein [Leptolyngbya sp. PL-A3]
MASLSKDKGTTWRIQFVDRDGNRRTIRVGKMTARAAETFRRRIEGLIGCQIAGHPIDAELAEWVRDLPDDLHGRVANTGLLPHREQTAGTLGTLLDNYFATIDVKPSTRTRYKQTETLLLEHFGAERALRTIHKVDADRWRAWLVESGYAPAKVAKEVGIARQVFRMAARWDMIARNPFEGVRAGSQRNRDRLHYVGAAETGKLLEAAGSADWRCIIALARIGGLRCPSEVLRARWADVDWEANRLRVESPKTEGHAGKAERTIPLFPELRRVLLESFEEAEPGAVFVVGGYRDATAANLRTQFARIVKRAGLTQWPRLFNALRASRATELAAEYPAAICTAWMGHSAAVAEAHYQIVRDEDYARAAASAKMGGAPSGARAAQMAAQQAHADNRKGSQNSPQAPKEAGVTRSHAEDRERTRNGKVGATGLEPVTSAM